MSKKHPIVAVTGSSGSGRSVVREAFAKVCQRDQIVPAFIDGEAFHRFNRAEMKQAQDEAVREGGPIPTHFGPEANLWEELEELFRQYGETGTGRHRRYIHSEDEATENGDDGAVPGEFTAWEDLSCATDLMIYEGLHGVVKTDKIDVGRHVDLRIGVTPNINLEWINKITRDVASRGYSPEQVMDTILQRMPDYVRYIIPQFHHSDINFQKISIVDTSAPIIARDMPNDTETMIVIRFRDPTDPRVPVDFPYLLSEIPGARMTRKNTILAPGGQMGLAMELILPPVLERLMDQRI